jgi:hypothetical protein
MQYRGVKTFGTIRFSRNKGKNKKYQDEKWIEGANTMY